MVPNGHAPQADLKKIDVSRLKVTLSSDLKPIPSFESMLFGKYTTDHMLIMDFDPERGWSTPEIKPYGPLSLDPASSCFQYCPNVFEGTKAYLGPDGKPRLFRPNMNLARLASSVERIALPPFDADALLILIKRLIMIDQRWIPSLPGYSLYIRPTIIGTRVGLGVTESNYALLYVILSPSGPYFPPSRSILKRRNWVRLLASSSTSAVRAWPGGTGSYKLGLNYSPCFAPQREAESKGYSQILWVLPVDTDKGKDWKVCEAGNMNVMCAIRRDDGGVDILTPVLDGIILPGVTRDSILKLIAEHNKGLPLRGLSSELQIQARETEIYMSDILRWSNEGRLIEMFGTGTAAIIAGIWKVGWEDDDIVVTPEMEDVLKDSEEDTNGLGKIGKALYDRLLEIQEGRVDHEWSVVIE
ncbi:hypothetical protein Clacol_008098 [Clathrus columnatus]|uniref:Branched-chain-amino-acid aminotransferase n=1 Tax=Clathrus columnatus TaxID=1419009 RepID=A0AAV5ALN4_9AGAM|nr:hypothetical protein Clacol_008098 [Clathrus columnatus]